MVKLFGSSLVIMAQFFCEIGKLHCLSKASLQRLYQAVFGLTHLNVLNRYSNRINVFYLVLINKILGRGTTG